MRQSTKNSPEKQAINTGIGVREPKAPAGAAIAGKDMGNATILGEGQEADS